MLALHGREEDAMQASAGDRIVVRSRHIGEPDRDGEILEVRGPGGTPPYVVRWSSDGHVGLYFPASDAIVHHHPDEKAAVSTPAVH